MQQQQQQQLAALHKAMPLSSQRCMARAKAAHRQATVGTVRAVPVTHTRQCNFDRRCGCSKRGSE